jgi:hypothetical protein
MNSATLLAGRRVDHHDLAALAQRGDGREVFHRVVGQLLEQVLVGRVRGVGGDEHGVAIGPGLGHLLRGDEAAGAGLVVDDDGLLRFGPCLLPSARAIWSVAVPAAKGTTKVMGLSGKACAWPSSGARASAAVEQRRGEIVSLFCLRGN